MTLTNPQAALAAAVQLSSTTPGIHTLEQAGVYLAWLNEADKGNTRIMPLPEGVLRGDGIAKAQEERWLSKQESEAKRAELGPYQGTIEPQKASPRCTGTNPCECVKPQEEAPERRPDPLYSHSEFARIANDIRGGDMGNATDALKRFAKRVRAENLPIIQHRDLEHLARKVRHSPPDEGTEILRRLMIQTQTPLKTDQ